MISMQPAKLVAETGSKTCPPREYRFIPDRVIAFQRLLVFVALVWMAWGLPVDLRAQTGRVERGTISSAALAGSLFNDSTNRPYAVYLPPSYSEGERRYPVFYMLHGWTGDVESHLEDLPAELDRLIAARQIGEMIAVFVDGRNELLGSFYRASIATGDYETYIVRDLVSLIDARYRTLATKAGRGIAGFSMGGYGALHLAFNYPDLFSVAVSHGGYYDTTDGTTDGALREIARVNPKTAGDVERMSIRAQALFPFLPTAVANTGRPPFFYDAPYTYENGIYTPDPTAFQRLKDADTLNGDLARFLQKGTTLGALQIVHGTADALVVIAQARSLHAAMLAAGVPHAYEEHPGGHQFLREQALRFLAGGLSDAELYIAPPRLNVIRTGNDAEVTFPTQQGVAYRVERATGVESDRLQWAEWSTVAGTGQEARVTLSLGTAGGIVRLKAENTTVP